LSSRASFSLSLSLSLSHSLSLDVVGLASALAHYLGQQYCTQCGRVQANVESGRVAPRPPPPHVHRTNGVGFHWRYSPDQRRNQTCQQLVRAAADVTPTATHTISLPSTTFTRVPTVSSNHHRRSRAHSQSAEGRRLHHPSRAHTMSCTLLRPTLGRSPTATLTPPPHTRDTVFRPHKYAVDYIYPCSRGHKRQRARRAHTSRRQQQE
jgi:hypothetical protein